MSEPTGTELRTPFVDDALMEQRQQQREVLLSIPKWLADDARKAVAAANPPTAMATTPPLPPPSLAQRILVERHARDRVDDLLDQLQVALAPVVDRGVAETVDGYLAALLAKGPSPAAAAWRTELADDLASEIDINQATLGEMIGLLLIADDLANDGFTDLRFS